MTVITNQQIVTGSNYSMDNSTPSTFSELIECSMDLKQIYGTQLDVNMRVSGDELLDFFVEEIPSVQYRIFFGSVVVLWNSYLVVRFRAKFGEDDSVVNQIYNESINISGEKASVQLLNSRFLDHFKEKTINRFHAVDLVVKSQNGLEEIRLPIKSDRHFYPEMYPVLGKDPHQYIDDFLNSSANVLIMIGDPGLGKSALINEIVLRARKFTQIVYDKDVMGVDQLYTQFISRSLREEGGIMVMEDADIVLSDRIMSTNETMSRILNMSDGIVDTSGAKFILSANIKSKEDIDAALTRPGRCFDIIEFRSLTNSEATIAAEAIGVELFDDSKDEYTVAEIFNSTANRTEKKHKVGFF